MMTLKPSSIQKRRTSWVRRPPAHPGFFLLGVPDHQESAATFGLGSAEGGAAANPGGIGTAQEALGGQPASTFGAESDVLPVAHTGMPALGAYLLPQFGTGYAPVAEHDDGHIPGNRWGQFLEQFHRGVHPGAFLGGLVDAPGHGDGAATVDDADDDGGDLVPFQRPIAAWSCCGASHPGTRRETHPPVGTASTSTRRRMGHLQQSGA